MKKVSIFIASALWISGCSGNQKLYKLQDRFSSDIVLNGLFKDDPHFLNGVVCDAVLGGTTKSGVASISMKISPSGRWFTIEYSPRYLLSDDQFLAVLKGEARNVPNLKIVRVLK